MLVNNDFITGGKEEQIVITSPFILKSLKELPVALDRILEIQCEVNSKSYVGLLILEVKK